MELHKLACLASCCFSSQVELQELVFLHPLQILLVELVRMTPDHVTPSRTSHTERSLTIQTLVGFQFQVYRVDMPPDLGSAVRCVEHFTAILANYRMWNCF